MPKFDKEEIVVYGGLDGVFCPTLHGQREDNGAVIAAPGFDLDVADGPSLWPAGLKELLLQTAKR